MRIFYLLSTYLLFSCSGSSFNNDNEFYNSLESSYTLSKKHEKKIPLDTLSDAFIFSYQITQDPLKEQEEFLFLNQRTNSIYFYNWEKSELNSILTLPTEGPNGVGLIKGFKHIHDDSLFVYAGNHTISLVNKEGEVLSRIKTPFYPEMPEGKPIYAPSIEVTGTSPLIFKDNKFFMGGKIDGEFDDFGDDNCFSFTVVDFESGMPQFILPFPDIYYKGNWIGSSFRRSFSTFNETADEIIVSYPASHHLVKYNITNGATEKAFGASNIAQTILPMERDFSELTSPEKWGFYIGSDSYGPVVWDKYRKVYYRIFLEKNPNTENLTGKGDLYKDMSIIILDQDFNYMGETEFPGSIYENNTFFVSKDGLVLFNYAAYIENENYLSYDIFELRKL